MDLDYLEIEITEFCNLNCAGCCDCSNLAAEKRFYEFEEYKKDLTRMREIFDGIEKIRLMGGEPFLNPRITDYARFAKELFPGCDLRIVTNGILIPGIQRSILTELKDTGAFLDISNYPPTGRLRSRIKNTLEECGIGYNFGPPMYYFFKTFLDKPDASGDKAFRNCIFSHCHMLGHGRLAPCSYAYCAGRLNEKFGTSYPEDDFIDIYSDIKAEEIIRFFSHTHSFCRYCSTGMVPVRWRGGVTASRAKLSDWTVKRDSPVTKTLAVVQSMMKKPAITLRRLAQRRNNAR